MEMKEGELPVVFLIKMHADTLSLEIEEKESKFFPISYLLSFNHEWVRLEMKLLPLWTFIASCHKLSFLDWTVHRVLLW